MPKWEYKVITLGEKTGGHGHIISPEEEEKKLATLGSEEWELVAVIPAVGAELRNLVSNPRAYFKKKLS